MVESGGGAPASIVEKLAGKRMLLTGVTGFLAQVVFERLLADFPETHVTLLVRSQTGATSRERVEYLLRKPAFDTLRERVGDDGLVNLLDERVDVIDADFSRGEPPIPDGIDVAMHSAATVSFDPPIDEGFQTNLQGALNMYHGVVNGGSRPALVHVSTAYVAGVRKGVIPEGPLEQRVDYRLELELALQARGDVEAQSRKPEMLGAFLEAARKEHERAGPSTVADDAEERRQKWVTKRLVEYGRMRARSLGWPDVYTFTKAMGERAVEELAAAEGLPLSIVRPSIIESALLHPFPGWIDGFKMADPIIRAYGLGQIPEFPGIPEGIIDLIPVDFVVNALLAIAANPPEPATAVHYNVSSGSQEPAALLRAVRVDPRILRGAPVTRAWARRAQGAGLGLPRPPQGRADAPAGRAPHRPRGTGRHAPAQVQGDARRRQPRGPRQSPRGLREALQRPLRDVHGDRGRLHRRPHARALRVDERCGTRWRSRSTSR